MLDLTIRVCVRLDYVIIVLAIIFLVIYFTEKK